MRINASLLLMFLVVSLPISAFSGTFMSHQQKHMIPNKGKTLLFVGQDGDTLREYVNHLGKIPTGVMFYTSIQRMEGLDAPIDIGAGPQYADQLLKDYPQAQIQIGLYMVGVLEGITTGKYDDNLSKLSEWIRRAERPIYLRIGYEFDNPENQYEPLMYKKAFVYIVHYLRQQKLTNLSFVWHSYTAANQPHPWKEYYPGDDYVDWFGASIFATGNIPYATKFHQMSKEHKKPFMIAESSPSGMYTKHGKKDWFTHVFRFIEMNDIEIFSYINSNWDAMLMFKSLNWGDARIEKDTEIKDLWLHETSKKRFRH